jgi:hypothetical protein
MVTKLQREIETGLRVGDLSELLVLSVLDRLGSAPIPTIFEQLVLVTKNGKAPFIVGPSIRQLLEWRGRLNEVERKKRGKIFVYSITATGKRTVQEHSPIVQKLFPYISRVKPHNLALSA